jgi:hypothetical protein
MPSWSPPRLISIELSTRCSRDHHQTAREAERDLQRKLIGDADVAGKRQQKVALSISTVIRRI